MTNLTKYSNGSLYVNYVVANRTDLFNHLIIQLQTLSGEKDVDKIISKFIKEEEENYALFNYVNELSHEIESLDLDTQHLEDSIGMIKNICNMAINGGVANKFNYLNNN